MKTYNFHIGNIPIAHIKCSHYCTESAGNLKRWLRDDFNIKNVQQKNISVFSEIDYSELLGFPFGECAVKKRNDYKKYTLLINNKLFIGEQIILCSEQFTNSKIIHYIFSAHGQNVHSVGSEQELILDKISSREIEVLVMLAKGHSMKSIAKQLFLSPHTIDSHRLNLCRKLKVRRIAELAVWAYKLGLLDETKVLAPCQ